MADTGLDGFTDDLTTLESTDDAATVKLGGGARMPTQTEWQVSLSVMRTIELPTLKWRALPLQASANSLVTMPEQSAV